MLNYTLKVAEIKQETKDAVTICFKQPGLKKVKYTAGQYLTLNFRINNRRYSRAYSFSSAPDVDATLDITVKRTPKGIVSNHIADCLKVGDVVEVIEPLGDFTLNNKGIDAESHLVFWGAGSGITPLFSMIKFALHHKTGKQVTLVYGNHNFESTVFIEQILVLQKQYGSRFSVWHFHSKPNPLQTQNHDILHGRIDVEKILKDLKNQRSLDQTLHFICGPAGLKDAIKPALKNYGVKEARVFSEEFGLITNSEVFEGISTRTVSINKAGTQYQTEVIKGKTILEAALDADIDLPYSCQTGTCLLCKGTLLSGELRSVLNDNITRNIAANECLLCCTVPLTDNVEILVA